MVTLPIVFPTDGHYTLYFSGTNNVRITVSGVSGEPILLDATLLNANSIYTFYIQNTSGVRQLFEIGEVEYDCFKIKIDAYFSIDATEDITPTQPCTLMCQETYDPMHKCKDIFDYNNLHVKAVADGTTITGDGSAGNPFVAIGGMVYPGVGIAVSTGASWDTSITDNSTNWDAAYSWVNTNGANAVTAYGWGNHASAGYLTGITSLQVTTALGYTPVTNARTLTINGTTYDLSANRSWTISAGTTYTFSTGLKDNAGTVTSNLSTGVSGGQSVIGGTASGNNLTLSSTSNATKGKILFGTSAYDEVNNRLGLRTTSPGLGAIYIQSSGAEVEDGITWSNGARIGYFTTAYPTIEAVTGGSLWFRSKNQTGLRLSDNSGNQAFSFAMVDQTTTTNQTIVFGGDYIGFYRSVGTTVAGIDRNGSTLSFFANSGAAGSYASFTPNKILSIDGANSRVGIGQSSPTAVLHLKAGTATANTAPLKFTTGTNLTTAEAGVMEYNNTFHLTNSDATRRHIVTAPNTTKVTAAAPYTNDGYITVNIGGTDFKLMTTA